MPILFQFRDIKSNDPELHASGQYYVCSECGAHFETKGSLKDLCVTLCNISV